MPPGTLEPDEVVDVCAEHPGEVSGLCSIPTTFRSRLGHGTHVEPGTPLLRLDDKLFVARVNQAKANVTKAEADIEAAKLKAVQTARELDRVHAAWRRSIRLRFRDRFRDC